MSAAEELRSPRLTRRGLLIGGAGAAALLAGETSAEAKAAAYPNVRVIDLAKLRVNRPHSFDYPLKGQSSVLLDLGRAVPKGVGPKRSIVAFSVFCQHMGCATEYRAKQREFFCPCHQSRYDPERVGAIIQGVATRALPRVLLSVHDGGVYATGVDGLIYGYRSNLTPGKKVGGTS